ncbi:MAG: hypothetical protein WD096_08835 [Actinomycetota bacterium]
MIAWRVGAHLEAAMVPVADEVVDELRASCRRTVDQLASSEVQGYDPDALVERGSWMAVPSRIVDEDGSPVADIVRRASGLDRIDAREIPNRLLFYAVAVGDSPGERAGFIRKADPHKSSKPGRLLAALGEVLARIQEPVFLLDDRFDLVLVPEGVMVLNQVAFDLLFREAPELALRAPRWIEGIAQHLPFGDGAVDQLVQACEADTRLARRLRSIYERGHLESVSLDRVRKEVERQGLEVREFIRDGSLIADDPRGLLYLLNEDLFVGGLSDTPYQVDRKSARN